METNQQQRDCHDQQNADRRAAYIEPACLDRRALRRQNRVFAGTGGVSQANRQARFVPAFFNSETGTAVVSRFANGTPAPVHVLDGLPDTWVSQRGQAGQVVKTCNGVVAGFMLGEQFYTRDQAAAHCAA